MKSINIWRIEWLTPTQMIYKHPIILLKIAILQKTINYDFCLTFFPHQTLYSSTQVIDCQSLNLSNSYPMWHLCPSIIKIELFKRRATSHKCSYEVILLHIYDDRYRNKSKRRDAGRRTHILCPDLNDAATCRPSLSLLDEQRRETSSVDSRYRYPTSGDLGLS